MKLLFKVFSTLFKFTLDVFLASGDTNKKSDTNEVFWRDLTTGMYDDK